MNRERPRIHRTVRVSPRRPFGVTTRRAQQKRQNTPRTRSHGPSLGSGARRPPSYGATADAVRAFIRHLWSCAILPVIARAAAQLSPLDEVLAPAGRSANAAPTEQGEVPRSRSRAGKETRSPRLSRETGQDPVEAAAAPAAYDRDSTRWIACISRCGSSRPPGSRRQTSSGRNIRTRFT